MQATNRAAESRGGSVVSGEIEWRLHATFFLVAASVLSLAWILRLDRDGQVVTPMWEVALPQSCMFRRLTGYDCAGCGLTRSFICVARGQLVRAGGFNPAGPLVFAFVLAQIPYRLIQLGRIKLGKEPLRCPGAYIVLGMLVVALLGQWLFRMMGGWTA